MKNKIIRMHQATRPLEYVAVYCFKMHTKEGPGYVYGAVDGYSAFAFLTGVEPGHEADTILRHIGLLIEHPDFVKHIDKGFTLVFSQHKELADSIKKIISPVNGRFLYDPDYARALIAPVAESMKEYFGNLQMP